MVISFIFSLIEHLLCVRCYAENYRDEQDKRNKMKIPASKGLPSKPTAEYTMRGAIFKVNLGLSVSGEEELTKYQVKLEEYSRLLFN